MKQLTDEQLCNAYISYRHDFGLMSKEDKDCLVFEAREWARAFNLTGEAQPAADPLHPEFIAGFKAGRYAGLRKLESMPEDAVNPELGGVQCPKCSTQFTAFLVSQPAADDKAGGEPVAYVNKATLEEVRSQGGAMFVTLNSSAEFADEVPLYTATQPQSEAGRVPDGWKLVPVEPTPEMVKYAMLECGGIGSGSCGEYLGVDGDDMRSVYSAMLDAAPKL